jgi:peptide deformylase
MSLSQLETPLTAFTILKPEYLLIGRWLNYNMLPSMENLSVDHYEVFINPQILGASELEDTEWEYCISFPNLRGKKSRPWMIRVSYIDTQAKLVERDLKGFHARLFYHEFDH